MRHNRVHVAQQASHGVRYGYVVKSVLETSKHQPKCRLCPVKRKCCARNARLAAHARTYKRNVVFVAHEVNGEVMTRFCSYYAEKAWRGAIW